MAIKVVGADLKWGDGASTETFTAFATVVDATGPTMDREEIDVSSWDSTGGYREYIGGFRDGGTISGTMIWSEAGYDKLLDLYTDDTNSNFQLVLSDATTYTFAGFVKTCGLAMASADAVKVNFTIRVSGAFTKVSA